MTEFHRIAPAKPNKPYPEFPLFAHATGRWAKKIRGQLHYFGPWANPDAALQSYLDQKDSLHAGRKPRPVHQTLTVKELANEFLNAKQALVDAGELSPRTWADYKIATDLIVACFGKSRVVADLDPDDFANLRRKMVKRWGKVRVRNYIQYIRSIFKFGFDKRLIAVPVCFGPEFARPSKKVMRLERASAGPRMFEADELIKIIDTAGVPLKAMILLGVNAGYGNSDVGTLPQSAVDLEAGWVNYHRPKTGIERRCPLWPETVQALKEALAKQPGPKDPKDAGLFFLTKYGGSWHKETEDNPLSKEMRKLLDSLDINGHRNFYALRHTFETIGGEARDQVAVDYVMGHARDDMASVYRERISDERLRAVTDHVRNWLFGALTTA
jgi:integrase